MKHYRIFRHPDERIEPVKQGWSWPAFLFVGFWALAKRMWVPSLCWIAAVLILDALVDGLRAATAADSLAGRVLGLCVLIPAVIFGALGNAWREANLRRRGFEDEGFVAASTRDGAVARFLNQAAEADSEEQVGGV